MRFNVAVTIVVVLIYLLSFELNVLSIIRNDSLKDYMGNNLYCFFAVYIYNLIFVIIPICLEKKYNRQRRRTLEKLA